MLEMKKNGEKEEKMCFVGGHDWEHSVAINKKKISSSVSPGADVPLAIPLQSTRWFLDDLSRNRSKHKGDIWCLPIRREMGMFYFLELDRFESKAY